MSVVPENEESPHVDFSYWTNEQGGSIDISFRLGLKGPNLVGQKNMRFSSEALCIKIL